MFTHYKISYFSFLQCEPIFGNKFICILMTREKFQSDLTKFFPSHNLVYVTALLAEAVEYAYCTSSEGPPSHVLGMTLNHRIVRLWRMLLFLHSCVIAV